MSPTDNTRGVTEPLGSTSTSPNAFSTGPNTPDVFARADEDPVARKRVLPLTSFEDTPQNVASISFLLGALFCAGSATLILGPAASTSSILVAATQPKLGAYAACWALFHLLEYVVTAIYNPTRVKVSSFLLNNGKAYHVAHAFGIVEFVLGEAFLPDRLRPIKHLSWITAFGTALVFGGQVVRTLAMATAAQSFTHFVSSSKKDDHVLVTHGIYSWSRHPSYVAFFYWAVGTQVLLGNPVAAVGFARVLWTFFNSRIKDEEAFLVRFFGDDYKRYRARVGTKLPFIA